MAAPQTPDRSVAKRAVFYIPGYDPIHPRRYRELYRTKSAVQAEISGYVYRWKGVRVAYDIVDISKS